MKRSVPLKGAGMDSLNDSLTSRVGCRGDGLRVMLQLIMLHIVSAVLTEHIEDVAGLSGNGLPWAMAGIDQRDTYRVQTDPKTQLCATAGQPLVLQLEARDALGSAPDESHSHLFADLRAASIQRQDIHCTVGYHGPGRYRITVMGQATGHFNLTTTIGISGIKASFFDGPRFVESSRFSERLVPSVAWDSIHDICGDGTLPSGIRWEGAIRPALSGNYSFTLEVDGVPLRKDVCLKIAGTYHLGCQDRAQASVRLSTLKFEKFSLDIIRPPSGRLRLLWQSSQLLREVVPAGVLFALLPIQQTVLDIKVEPGHADAQESTTTKPPSSMTVGEQVSVMIETRDEYGTVTDSKSKIIAVTSRHHSDGVRHRNTLAVRTDVGKHEASLVPHTVSGLVSLSSSLVQCTGIHATYYSDVNLRPASASKATMVDAVDFSAVFHRSPLASSVPFHTPYSIRWAGMLRPIHADTYTMYASTQSSDERVKVWVDNVLLIDMWSSVGGSTEMSGTLAFGNARGNVYDIQVEYQVGSDGNRGLVFKWLTLGGSRQVPLLCHAQHLRASMIEILPGLPTALQSELQRCFLDVGGVGDTVRAGQQLCFQLLLRDEFNNSAQPDMTNIEVSGRDQLERMVYLEDFLQR